MSVVNGSLAGVHNLRIKVEIGAVRVEGGANQGISYVIRNKSYESSEERARRQFDSYKISAYVRGDTAWIVGDWEGGRPRKFSSEVTVTVPREMEAVKIETDGGAIVTTGIAGSLEAQSGGGTIHLDDIGGPIVAETGGEAIDVGNVGVGPDGEDRRRRDSHWIGEGQGHRRKRRREPGLGLRVARGIARNRRRQHSSGEVHRGSKSLDRGREH